MNLELKDKWELLALHKIIFEAKYSESPDNLDVQGSPLAKDIYEKVFSLLIEQCKSEGDLLKVEQWHAWRKLENHPDRLENLKTRLRAIHFSSWVPLNRKDKVDYIECLVSPLLPNAESTEELISYANSLHSHL